MWCPNNIKILVLLLKVIVQVSKWCWFSELPLFTHWKEQGGKWEADQYLAFVSARGSWLPSPSSSGPVPKSRHSFLLPCLDYKWTSCSFIYVKKQQCQEVWGSIWRFASGSCIIVPTVVDRGKSDFTRNKDKEAQQQSWDCPRLGFYHLCSQAPPSHTWHHLLGSPLNHVPNAYSQTSILKHVASQTVCLKLTALSCWDLYDQSRVSGCSSQSLLLLTSQDIVLCMFWIFAFFAAY